MKTKYFFFKTVRIEGRPRLRPLLGQLLDGNPIDPSLNVQADSIMRGSYPLGTIFGSESIELRAHSSTPFYSAGSIFPMGLNLGSYIVGSHIPPKEMTEAWNNFNEVKVPEPPIIGNLFSTTGEVTAPGSLLQQLKADSQLAVPTIQKDGFFISP